MENAEGVAGEPQGGHGGVLHLEALVSELSGPGEDLHGYSQKPHQQVDGVNALIEEGAAVQRACAAPLGAVVVLLASPPGHGDETGRESPEAAQLDRIVNGEARWFEAVL